MDELTKKLEFYNLAHPTYAEFKRDNQMLESNEKSQEEPVKKPEPPLPPPQKYLGLNGNAYTKPHLKISDTQMEEWIKSVREFDASSSEVLEFHIDHPYYRDMLKVEAQIQGLVFETYQNSLFEKTWDNTLIYHDACKDIYPEAHVDWIQDYDEYYAHCPNSKCDHILHHDYENDEEKGFTLGFKRLSGKNCIAIAGDQQALDVFVKRKKKVPKHFWKKNQKNKEN